MPELADTFLTDRSFSESIRPYGQESLAKEESTAGQTKDSPLAGLHDHFGFSEFRPGQQQAVEAALAGRDTLVVMPTGAGKSLCYQLPSLQRDDLTIVVSPLVSLMQDQVESFERIAPGRVALINSQQSGQEKQWAMDRVQSGDVKILYVAPERFSAPNFRDAIKSVAVGLFVVDEAHCVAEWGHDFRPDYFRLGDAARWLEADTIMAVTATATPLVANEIVSRLGLRDPVRVVTGFDRPALSFGVVQCVGKEQVGNAITVALSEPGALPAIVYTGTRSRSERLAEQLTDALGVQVVNYHAGLGASVRAETQRKFMEGEVPVVVATNAFGMGVDKADVRTVCHDGAPGSLEAYYQEAGRAGRDRSPARCLLFTCGKDKGLHVFFIERSEVKGTALSRVAKKLLESSTDGRYSISASELADAADCDDGMIRPIIGHLVNAGFVKPTPSSADQLAGSIIGEWDRQAFQLASQSAHAATQVKWRQYRAVWKWVEGGRCRRSGLLQHFGDRSRPVPEVACCDVCDPNLTQALLPIAREKKRSKPVSKRKADRESSGARGADNSQKGTKQLTQYGEGGFQPQVTDSQRPDRRQKATADPEVSPLSTSELTDLDTAILSLVERAKPKVGRTRAVSILRGGRSKEIVKHSYDGLPQYGTFSHLRGPEVLARVDELLEVGKLCSSGGRFPKLLLADDQDDEVVIQSLPAEQYVTHMGKAGPQSNPSDYPDCETSELTIEPLTIKQPLTQAGHQEVHPCDPRNLRIGVLVSGPGINLQAVLDRIQGHEGMEVVAVGADSADAVATAKRTEVGDPVTKVFPGHAFPDKATRDQEITAWLKSEHNVDLVVLA